MGQISISEDTLRSLANAIRNKLGTKQPLDIKSMARGVNAIESSWQPFTWVTNDGNTYFYLEAWNEQFLTINLDVQLIGTVDWGDGEVESFNDSAITTHSHTYPCPGYYGIKLIANPTVILGGSPCIHGNTQVNRYTEYVEVGDAAINGNAVAFPAGKEIFFGKQIVNCPSVGGFGYLKFDSPTISGYYQNSSIKEIWGNEDTQTIITLTNRWQYTKLVRTKNILWNRTNTTAIYWYCGIHGYEIHYKDPFGVTSIPDEEAFNQNAGGGTEGFIEPIFYINFPSNVTSINIRSNAYGDHFKIAPKGVVICSNPTPPTLSRVFTLYEGAKIYVPHGSLSAYQSASNWSAIADYMEELSE